MRSTRMTAIAAGVVIMVAGLSACNDKGGDGDKAGGSTGGSSSTGGSTGGSGSSSSSGVADALKAAQSATDAKKTVQVDTTKKMGTGTATSKGGVDWNDGVQMNVEISMSGGKGKPMKTLYTKDAVYTNLGMAIGGKSWMKTSFADLAKKPGGAATQELVATAKPSQSIEWLLTAKDLKAVGKEDVKGVEATHYSGTISYDVEAKGLSPEAQEALKKQLAASKVKSQKLDIWIDSENLLVKQQAESGGSTGTSYYSGYGTKVDVTPPPASDVMEQHG
ncbi:hypothetical protein ACIRPT_11555 [Streptomyces sp. NPDC101227]|uniref:hypothetical protein n=1 Tax=Streptomyces sp. NPDC101227 TaxID=3366136 RepID=UPI00380A3F40